MGSILLVGVNHRTAPLAVRERLGFGRDSVGTGLQQLVEGSGGLVEEALILFTCNRTEVFAGGPSAAPALRVVKAFLSRHGGYGPGSLDPFLYELTEDAVVQHIFEVAAGLDSMVLGEAQILGQVKEALALAQAAGTLQATGQRLFRQAIETGKRVRRETAIGQGAASLPGAAVQLAIQVFGSLAGRSALVVGAGKVGELATRNLAAQGVRQILVANRTLTRGEAVARRVGGVAIPYREACSRLEEVDLILTQANAPHFIFTRERLARAVARRRGSPLLVIDLSVPRVVEPSARDLPGLILYDVDDLSRVTGATLQARAAELEQARRIVAEEVERFNAWRREQEVAPVIQALRSRAEAIRQHELERLYAKLPAEMRGETFALIDASTRAMLQKLLHTPTVRLKQASEAGHGAHAHVLAHLFDL